MKFRYKNYDKCLNKIFARKYILTNNPNNNFIIYNLGFDYKELILK